jgi:hypothetical protein
VQEVLSDFSETTRMIKKNFGLYVLGYYTIFGKFVGVLHIFGLFCWGATQISKI